MFWWNDEPVPDRHFAPESAVSGLIKIDDDGRATLEMHGFLPSPARHSMEAFFSNRGEELQGKCIQGVLKGSTQRVLLVGLHKNGGHFQSNGMSYEGYSAQECLVGHGPFPASDVAPKIRSLTVYLDGFEAWLRLGGITFSRSDTEASASYKKPDDASYDIDDGTLSVKFHLDSKFPGFSRAGDLSIKERASLVYDLKTPETLDDARARFGLLEDFLILLTDSDYCFDWPHISLSEDLSCRWYFSRIRPSEPPAPPLEHDCWTNFIRLRGAFGEMWSTWKRKRQEYGPGLYLYFGIRRGITLFTEHRFMNLVWGVEALHRKKNPSSASPAFKEKIDRILAATTEAKDRKWLDGRLKHAYEKSLEERIYESFKNLPLNLDKKRLRAFAKACADRRNEISHFDGHGNIEGESYSQFIIDLDRKSDTLSTLYHALLLQEVGVEAEILRWWIYEGFQSFQIKVKFVQNGLLDKSAIQPKTDAAAEKAVTSV